MSWEDTFKSWGASPGATEQQKMDNAENAVRKAIKANAQLSSMDISIISQGSYRSKTNVKNDSDVDICVCLNSTFFPRYPDGKTKEDYGNTDGSISFREFKDHVQKALYDYFGQTNVSRGNKAFDIHSNSYRIDADVVPALAYRYYYDSGDNWHQPEGVCFLTDNGDKIINWPHQTYENCKNKHEATGQRYRKVIRILKRLRNKMQDENIIAARDIPSFLIQSMVWSASDENFNHDTYAADVRAVLAYCFNQTLTRGNHATLREVNNIKYIYGSHQPCTREKAHTFFSEAWDYLGFQ